MARPSTNFAESTNFAPTITGRQSLYVYGYFLSGNTDCKRSPVVRLGDSIAFFAPPCQQSFQRRITIPEQDVADAMVVVFRGMNPVFACGADVELEIQ